MIVRFEKDFNKSYLKSDSKIRKTFDSRLIKFIKNPFHPQLNNHSLTGKYSGYRSINITGDWRAIYSNKIDKEGNHMVVFSALGTHSQLYK